MLCKALHLSPQTFTRPAQLIKPFHNIGLLQHMPSVWVVGEENTYKERNRPIPQLTRHRFPKQRSQRAKEGQQPLYWQLLTDHKTQLPRTKASRAASSQTACIQYKQETSKNFKKQTTETLSMGKRKRKDFVPLSRQEMAISHANFRNTFSAWLYTFYPLTPSLVNSCLLREYLREHWKAEYLLELDYA